MGLLSSGTPLGWHESAPYRKKVKEDGIEQFLHIYNGAKDFHNQGLKWGDEVEYILLRFDKQKQQVQLSMRAPELIEELGRDEHAQPEGSSVPVLWRPEYATWMIEGTPGVPYRCYAADLTLVERNMGLRRTEIKKLLGNDEAVLTIAAFPRTGCASYTHPRTLPYGPVARSFFTSDKVINPHPRFATLSRNIRLRRGRKVDISVPLFLDTVTKIPQPLIPDDKDHMALLNEASNAKSEIQNRKGTDTSFMSLDEGRKATAGSRIKMDSSAFGMGCCSLQVTLQGRDIHESRFLYDQLAVMAPLMLAITAATPALRGLVADTDVRWNTISSAMDDRTEEEIETGSIPKSRYSSIDCYISDRAQFKPESYNDIPVPIDPDTYVRLIEGGVDHLLAQHIAHLYIREPLAIYKERLDQDNTKSADHFENIQSTNWNTVRFKPPPPESNIGWRTEFRSMEVALTDFENAAFSVFIVILSRVILAFNLNFYTPMSLVDENMDRAHERDAVNKERFHFRKNIFTSSGGSSFLCDCGHIHYASLVGGHSRFQDIAKFCRDTEKDASDSETDSHELMSLDTIFNGKSLRKYGRLAGFEFPGLLPLMRGYLDSINIDEKTRSRLLTYLDFVGERAAGKLKTTATYMREFILSHPNYKQDSVVSDQICFDLMVHCENVTSGNVEAPELLGRFGGERIPSEHDTPEGMMARMQETLEGAEGGLLLGSSLPPHALGKTITTLARLMPEGTECGKC